MENPYHINSYYLNPSDKEILAQKNEEIILENEKKKYEKYFTKRPRWINYHTRANLIRKEGFIDHKPPDFLRKGNYIEPFEIHVNLYRDDDHFDELFKLYHKPLKAIEKFQYLGQPIKKELSLKQSTN